MKRIFLIVLSIYMSASFAQAQGEMDAYRFSRNDLTGTARSVSMGGAFGALGGDISGVAINPAGIGVYTRSEVAATINFQNNKAENTFMGIKSKENKFKFSFDNFGLVASFPISSDEVPRLNFGFTYNKLKSFDRKYKSKREFQGITLVDYMAHRAYGYDSNSLGSNETFFDNDWLASLGYNSYLIDEDGQGIYHRSQYLEPFGDDSNNELFVREKGYINNYDFNFGTTISDMISLGLTISVTDIDYKMHSNYYENYLDSRDQIAGDYSLLNAQETDGKGWQLRAGVIFKPINEFRVGVAYHSPTWYSMTDHTLTGLYYDMEAIIPELEPREYIETDWFNSDYKLRTPDKWVFSAAGVLGNIAILSLDYEMTNYKNMKLKEDGFYFSYPSTMSDRNVAIKKHYKNSSSIRAGVEIRATPQFSIRGGYSWVESPLKKDFQNGQSEAMVVGSAPHFTLEGDTNYYTFGLGYRFTPRFYVDMAFMLGQQKEKQYMFSNFTRAEMPGVPFVTSSSQTKHTKFNALMTFGYRIF